MSLFALICRSLQYHRRLHAGLFLGALIACGILTGALLMGDSIDYSLRAIAEARLGRITYAVDGGSRLFDQRVATTLQQNSPDLHAETLLALRGIAALPPEKKPRGNQLNRVQVIGVGNSFWSLASQSDFAVPLGPQEAAINEKTARALGIRPGDDLSLRVEKYSPMPQDAPLSSRDETNLMNRLVTVTTVLSEAQLGPFSLSANQTTPYNIFVNRTWLQEQTEQPGWANRLVVESNRALPDVQNAMNVSWELEHIGLRMRTHSTGLVQLESTGIFLPEEVVRAAQTLPDAQLSLTYLVNSIAKGDRATPYSFVEAGPVPPDLRDDEAVINQWLSERIGAQPGDGLEVAYFQLLPNNTFVEKRHSLTVRNVVSMDSLAMERELAPIFPGLSDVETCTDWHIGMPMEEAQLNDPANEAYWKEFRQTPKLLTNFRTGQALWGNRFGSVTAIRFADMADGEAEIRRRLHAAIDPEKVGLRFLPVRRMALDAVNQATDFGALFVGMSFFLIVASLTLLGLLYGFGLQQRASEIGLLMALGYSQGRIRALFLLEAIPTTVGGLALGSLAGMLYARFLMAAIARYWSAAVTETTIQFYASSRTLMIGIVATLILLFMVLSGAVWRITRNAPCHLIRGSFAAPRVSAVRSRMVWHWIFPSIAFLFAVASILYALAYQPNNMIEPFFVSAMLLLVAGIGYYRACLRTLAQRSTFRHPSIIKIVFASLARRPSRSLSVAGLTACGCFLLFSVSSMQQNVALRADHRDSGTGGFALIAETAIPLTATTRDSETLFCNTVIPMRVRDGDDAGCLNLNHAQTPRLFGVDSARLLRLGAFVPASDSNSLWNLLEQPLADGCIPALAGDSNTALWGLKKRTGATNGDTLTYVDDSGKEFKLRLVGQIPLPVSIFQGSVLISETAFTRLFPFESGYRAFLADIPMEAVHETAAAFNRDFERFGMHAIPAVERLGEFYAVERTYLSMFLVLGGFGLLLGAGGTGIVVLRNVFERSREIAILHAVGYSRKTIFRFFLLEHAVLVLSGIVLGSLTAAVAILPMALLSQITNNTVAQLILFILVVMANLFSVTGVLVLGFPRQPGAYLREE